MTAEFVVGMIVGLILANLVYGALAFFIKRK